MTVQSPSCWRSNTRRSACAPRQKPRLCSSPTSPQGCATSPQSRKPHRQAPKPMPPRGALNGVSASSPCRYGPNGGDRPINHGSSSSPPLLLPISANTWSNTLVVGPNVRSNKTPPAATRRKRRCLGSHPRSRTQPTPPRLRTLHRRPARRRNPELAANPPAQQPRSIAPPPPQHGPPANNTAKSPVADAHPNDQRRPPHRRNATRIAPTHPPKPPNACSKSAIKSPGSSSPI